MAAVTVTSNVAEIVSLVRGDMNAIRDGLNGLHWELSNAVPYGPELDENYGMVDALYLTMTEDILPIESWAAGRMSWSSMRTGMDHLFIDMYNESQRISPRISNMFAEGTVSTNFIYEYADIYHTATPAYRDAGPWLGWNLDIPGRNNWQL